MSAPPKKSGGQFGPDLPLGGELDLRALCFPSAEASVLAIPWDDADAKAVATRLAEDLGFEAVDAGGGLTVACYLEPLAMLWIHLAIVQNLGRDIAFKLVRR